MPSIRPISDLRNNSNEISKYCKETGEPVFITKNGVGDMVVISMELYEQLIKPEETPPKRKKTAKVYEEAIETPTKHYEPEPELPEETYDEEPIKEEPVKERPVHRETSPWHKRKSKS